MKAPLAGDQGLIVPILFGPAANIRDVAQVANLDLGAARIVCRKLAKQKKYV